MEPRITHGERIVLAGYSFFGDPFAETGCWTEENEIGRLWDRFFGYHSHRQDPCAGYDEALVAYEVHVECDQTASTGHREVFVGIRVDTLDEVPVDLLVKVLPATQYVVFTLRGREIASDWSQQTSEWMLHNGYIAAYPYGFQLYDQRFKGLDNLEASELDVYIPIRPADDGSTDCDR